MKILHIADVHLGAEPDQDKPWGQGRERLQWDAFARAIEVAEEQQVDLVLIAGDLFHRQPLKRELKEVNAILSQLSRAKVVIMAGNHDYLTRNSFYRTFSWSENVYFLKSEQMECLSFPKMSTYIYGFSYEHREIRESRYENIPKQGSGYHILLAHGGDETHVPVRLAQLEALDFDYVAMGHIHKPMQLKENRIIMAGALQPLDCNEVGPHGYWLVDIQKREVNATFYAIRGCEYTEVEVEMSETTSNQQLVTLLQERINELQPYQLAKVELTGLYDPELPPDVERIKELERVAGVRVSCRPDYDFQKLKKDYEKRILGKYIKKIEAMPQDEVTRRALYLGVDALMGNSDVY